jgi:formylglycine-generating enzyme required for sulfatase activity
VSDANRPTPPDRTEALMANERSETKATEALTLLLPGDVELPLRLIPKGKFRMGSRNGWQSEQPVHWVELTESFYMGVTPVTQAQWRALVKARKGSGIDLKESPSAFKDDGDQLPVEQVSWIHCMQWCDLLTELIRSKEVVDASSGQELIRLYATLPTEAQWEYACRGPQKIDQEENKKGDQKVSWATTDYSNGDGDAALDQVGWYDENAGSQTQPVKGLSPNEWGLYDCHGNVWEWCWDDWDSDAYRKRVDGVQDPCTPSRAVRWQDRDNSDNADRVIRGGSWLLSAWICRAAYRIGVGPGIRDWNRGFRVCLLAPGPQPSQPAGEVGLESSPSQARRQAEAGNGDDGEPDLSLNSGPPPQSGGEIL